MKKFYEAPEMVIESVDCADVVTTSVVVPEPTHPANQVCYDEDVDNLINIDLFN